MDDKYRALEDIARNHYANVVWTHKIQEKQAEIYELRYKVLAAINIVFAALTSAGLISIIFADPTWLKVASAAVSFVTTAISAFLASFDYKSMAKDNKTAATKLVCARDELLSLLAKIKLREIPVSELMDVFDAIQKRVHEVYKDAPNTTNKAVKKADAALKKHKEGTYTEEEIDALLPEELKRRSEK